MGDRTGRRMGTRIKISIGLVSMAAVLVFSFQNCSGGGTQSTSNSGSTNTGGESSSPVSAIDPIRPLQQWTVSNSKVELASIVDNYLAQGLCESQESGRLTWSLEMPSLEMPNQTVAAGESVCADGHFELDLGPLQSLPCGKSALLIGAIGAERGPIAEVTRRCEPIRSKSVATLRESLVPEAMKASAQECQVEISSSSCEYICYGHDGRVVHQTALSGAICL